MIVLRKLSSWGLASRSELGPHLPRGPFHLHQSLTEYRVFPIDAPKARMVYLTLGRGPHSAECGPPPFGILCPGAADELENGGGSPGLF